MYLYQLELLKLFTMLLEWGLSHDRQIWRYSCTGGGTTGWHIRLFSNLSIGLT